MPKYKGIEFEESVVINYMLVEGLKFQEAVLNYNSRKKLPFRDFCGPNKTFLANNASSVKNAFVKLSQFGGRLGKKVIDEIHARLISKAERFRVEHTGCIYCVEKEKIEETVAWFKGLPSNAEFFKPKVEEKIVDKVPTKSVEDKLFDDMIKNIKEKNKEVKK